MRKVSLLSPVRPPLLYHLGNVRPNRATNNPGVRLQLREFQKMLDHRGVDPLSPYVSLAYLGLARADHLMGKKLDSLKAYEHFFELWKNADNDIPILQAARREYLALSHSAR